MDVKSVPFFRMRFSQSELNAVIKVIKSGWLTTGNISHEFERRFASYVKAKYAVAVSSCTAGLVLGLKALGIIRGDQVITTPYTFVASVESILHLGAKPVFVDIEPCSLNLDPSQLTEKITSKTRAIMPVHIAGLPCRMNKIRSIAKKYKLKIIHDAAHAIGSSYKGNPIGSINDIACFSFYATKNITTGEGGMITTNSKTYADRIRVLSLHGMDKKAWSRYLDKGSWYYEIVEMGYKYNLADMNAALGLAMLNRIDTLQTKRRRAANWYKQYLSKYDEIELPHEDASCEHAWHLYIIKLNLEKLKISRNEFIRQLNQYKVGTGVHFIPMFRHQYYKGKYGLRTNKFPHSEQAFQRVISLPFFPDIRKQEVKYVCDSIGKIISQNRKL